MTARNLRIMLTMLFVMDALLVGAVVGATTGNLTNAVLIGVAALAVPWFAIALVCHLIFAMAKWGEITRLYPVVPSAPDFERQQVTSIAIRSRGFRINNGIAAAADGEHLHLKPAMPVPMASVATSIPWSAVERLEPGKFGLVKLTLVEGPPLWVHEKFTRGELALREKMEREE